MTFLLDTNALSEPGRRSPNAGFDRWYGKLELAEISISAVSVGELRRGLSLLPTGARRSELQALYANLIHRFGAQVIPIDIAIAERWGDLSARLKRMGHVIGTPDELIAATALTRNLVLVTRNHRHFELCGCEVLTPWS